MIKKLINKIVSNWESAFALGGLVTLTGMVFYLSPANYVYDENVFAANFHLIGQFGISRELFLNLEGQSPGPLYQIVHYLFSGITDYDPLRIRTLNILFLFITLMFLTLALKGMEGHKNIWSHLLTALSIPAVWVIGGMALTEMPAILFLTLSIFFLFKSKGRPKSIIPIIFAGLALGIATLGRTQFVLAIIPFVYWLFMTGRSNLHWFLFAFLPLPLYMFIAWGGLVPPDVASIQSGFNLWFAFLGLGYLALFTLFAQPNWYTRHLDLTLISLITVCVVVFFLINNHFFQISFIPAKSVMVGLFKSNKTIEIIGFLSPAIILASGLTFMYCGLKNASVLKFQPEFIMALAATLLIVASTAKSSAQFSSRYIGQAFPFIIIYCSFLTGGNLRPIFYIAGAIIGIASLSSYFD